VNWHLLARLLILPRFEIDLRQTSSGHPLENENDPGSEVAMSISAVVGYIAILIALGFGVAATLSVVEKQGLLDRGRKSWATRARHYRALQARR